ncbi:MAG: MerR family transcriptional regulator [Sporomusaceae bacterium]|nr:MerR family transcriptional regulator [Sporomusaceae bacterium]
MHDEFLQKQFTTGQFAALYGINKRTLMYYDSIDLFKPAIVRKNGYRYYTFGQCCIFDSIQLLRRLRVPLEEIKNYLRHNTPQTLQTVLQNQSQMLQREIDELLWLQKVVGNKINNLETTTPLDCASITIVEAEAQPIVISRSTVGISMEQTAEIIQQFMQDCYQQRSYCGYPLGYMLATKEMRQGNFYQLANFFYRVDKQNTRSSTCKPAGRYLVGYYKGAWPEMSQALQQLVDYANSHRLAFADYAYAESILDDTAAAVEDPYYCEMQISISLQNTSSEEA